MTPYERAVLVWDAIHADPYATHKQDIRLIEKAITEAIEEARSQTSTSTDIPKDTAEEWSVLAARYAKERDAWQSRSKHFQDLANEACQAVQDERQRVDELDKALNEACALVDKAKAERNRYLETLQSLAAMWRPFMGLPMLDLVRAALSAPEYVNLDSHKDGK